MSYLSNFLFLLITVSLVENFEVRLWGREDINGFKGEGKSLYNSLVWLLHRLP